MRFIPGISSQGRQEAVESVGGVPSNFYPTDWKQPKSDWQRNMFGGNSSGSLPPAPSGGIDMSVYRPGQAQNKISGGAPSAPHHAFRPQGSRNTVPESYVTPRRETQASEQGRPAYYPGSAQPSADSGIRFPVIRPNPGRNDEPISRPPSNPEFFPVPGESNSAAMQQIFEQARRGGVSSEIVQQAIDNNQRRIPVTMPRSLPPPAGGFVNSPGFRESDYRKAAMPKYVPNPAYQNPDTVRRPSPQLPASPSPSVIGSGPMAGLPEGTKVIRGPQGGFVFPGSPPPMFTQQANGGYRPTPSQQPSLPPGFVPGQHVFSVTQTPGFSSAPPQLPEPGFTAQYRNFDGSVSDSPNYAQRDAFIQGLNDALLPYQTGRTSGLPTYDFPALLTQANQMVDDGYQNPFAFQNPLARLFG